MAAPALRFDPPYDIHLLRGQSLQIVNEAVSRNCLLKIGSADAFDFIDANPDISYTFRYSFDDAKAADFGIALSNPVAGDASAARKPDCLIALAAAEPALAKNQIRNFYLFAEAIDANIAAGQAGHKTETAVRIHIHNRLEEIWLTPDILTIYRGFSAYFSLRARFDDGAVAEIGTMFKSGDAIPINYRITNPVQIVWSSPSNGVDINRNSGRITVTDAASPISDIVIETTYNGQTLRVSTLLQASNKLGAQSELRAELAPSGHSKGFSRLNEIPNILFIAEGFKLEQKEEFKQLINNYICSLGSNKITSPFGLLKESINYWLLFVTSLESGVNTKGELVVYEEEKEDGTFQLMGKPLAFIENPKTKPVSEWKLEHLLYFVGLPIKTESSINNTVLQIKWATTTRISPANLDQLFQTRADLITEWKKYAKRKLPEMKNTAFGVTVNDYTAALKDGSHNFVDLSRKAVMRANLDPFFEILKDKQQQLIGPTFIKDAAVQQGKDWDNIVFIVATDYGRAINSQGYMFSTLGKTTSDDDGTQIVKLTGSMADVRVKLAAIDLPTRIPMERRKTITHEICHSFGLGDEYGEEPPKESDKNKPTNDAAVVGWQFANFRGDAEDLDWTTNLQAKEDLLVPVSTGGTHIQPYRIKWRYHRIKKCGIVTAVAINGNELTITLQEGQTAHFEVNKGVFVRKRKKNETAYLLTDASPEEKVLATILLPDPIAGDLLEEHNIQSVDAAHNKIIIDTTPPTELTLKIAPDVELKRNQRVEIRTKKRYGPIYTTFRTPPASPPTDIKKALSPLLTVKSIDAANHKLTLTIPTGVTLMDYLTTISPNEAMLVYHPLDVPEGRRSHDYPHYELIPQQVLNHLLVNPFAFNANSDKKEIIDRTSNTNIPSSLVPCCSQKKKQIIGLYAGGKGSHGGVYHAAAECMMRHGIADGHYVELCAVCRYTLINLIDPLQFEAFDEDYMSRKIYPD